LVQIFSLCSSHMFQSFSFGRRIISFSRSVFDQFHCWMLNYYWGCEVMTNVISRPARSHENISTNIPDAQRHFMQYNLNLFALYTNNARKQAYQRAVTS
jgi:hypothetical protein